jgi:hypothetical protein
MVHDQYIYIHQPPPINIDGERLSNDRACLVLLFKKLIRILAGISSYLGLLEYSPKIHRTHLLPFGLWSVR